MIICRLKAITEFIEWLYEATIPPITPNERPMKSPSGPYGSYTPLNFMHFAFYSLETNEFDRISGLQDKHLARYLEHWSVRLYNRSAVSNSGAVERGVCAGFVSEVIELSVCQIRSVDGSRIAIIEFFFIFSFFCQRYLLPSARLDAV